jgi:hypothetical protein
VRSFHHVASDTTIHHNGDYSGPVKITVPVSALEGRELSDLVYIENGRVWIEDIVPGVAIAALAHSAVIRQVVSAIEDLEMPAHGLNH